MGPSYTNPLDSENPNKWLNEQQISGLALELIFETRLLERLKYLETTYVGVNGLGIFKIMTQALSDLQSRMDECLIIPMMHEITDNPRSLEQRRNEDGLPVRTLLGQYPRNGISHITWQDVQLIKKFIDDFHAMKVIESEMNGLKQKMAEEVHTKLNLAPSVLFEKMALAQDMLTNFKGQEVEVGIHDNQKFILSVDKELEGVIAKRHHEFFIHLEKRLLDNGWLNQAREWTTKKTGDKKSLVELIAALKHKGLFHREIAAKGNQKLREFFERRYSIAIASDYMKDSKDFGKFYALYEDPKRRQFTQFAYLLDY